MEVLREFYTKKELSKKDRERLEQHFFGQVESTGDQISDDHRSEYRSPSELLRENHEVGI